MTPEPALEAPSEWGAAALTDRLAAYLVNAYTDGRGYDPADPDDVAVTLKDGFDIVLAEMREAQTVPVCHLGWPGCDWTGPHAHAPYHSGEALAADAERLGMTPDEYVTLLRDKQQSVARPDPDIEAVKAEGRRLLAECDEPRGDGMSWEAIEDAPAAYLGFHADALLAPAPKLTEEERELVEEIRNGTYGRPVGRIEALLAIIDRFTSPPTTEAPE